MCITMCIDLSLRKTSTSTSLQVAQGMACDAQKISLNWTLVGPCVGTPDPRRAKVLQQIPKALGSSGQVKWQIQSKHVIGYHRYINI